MTPPHPPAAEPDRKLLPAPDHDDQSSYAYRQVIGSLGLVLPFLLRFLAGERPTPGLPPWELLDSISAYYFTGAVAAFVGVLVALAVFLLTYKGYQNEHGRQDRVAGIIAGCAAVLVAFFPTRPPEGVPAPSWWTPGTGTIHFIGAAVLFGAFAYFSLFLFPKSNVRSWKEQPWDKKARNVVYIGCGLGILLCILYAWRAHAGGRSIFWPEALALELFAVSWLAKGRFGWLAVTVGKGTLHYALHPRQLVDTARRAVRG
jgi:hypothetical protein